MSAGVDDSLAIATLLSLRGVGRRTVLRALGNDSSLPKNPEDLFAWARANAETATLNPPLTRERILEGWEEAQNRMRIETEAGVCVLPFTHPGFPPQLRHIPDPPVLLYVRGDLETIRKPAIAVIGTREPTSYGREMANRIAWRLAKAGIVVVSGLAIGCDTGAHRGALEGGGPTVAVLAGGVDKPSPAANRMLADEIIRSGGALVSEYPTGSPAFPTNFVERDRLQSGLSGAILVIETGISGGTMHTVRFARDQRRVIACLTHPEEMRDEPKSQGNQELAKDPTTRLISALRDVDSLASAVRTNWADATTIHRNGQNRTLTGWSSADEVQSGSLRP